MSTSANRWPPAARREGGRRRKSSEKRQRHDRREMTAASRIGLNLWLGMRFGCMLGRHIFDHMGSGVKIHQGVDLTFGYKLSIGDGAVIHQGVLLHDRGGITIGKNAVIGSFVRIF